MNIRIARQILKQLYVRQAMVTDPERKAALVIATRWLEAANVKLMDAVCRLGVLEGAAHVPPRKWMNLGSAGLPKAQGYETLQGNIKASWFSQDPSGMYLALKALTSRAIMQYKAQGLLEADDVLNSMLSGIGLSSNEELGALPFYKTGENLQERILSGSMGPTDVAATLTTTLRHKVEAFMKKRKRETQIPTKEDGAEIEFGDTDSLKNEVGFGSALAISLDDPKVEPIILRLMKETWGSQPAMLLWAKTLQETGTFLPQSNLAALFYDVPQELKDREQDAKFPPIKRPNPRDKKYQPDGLKSDAFKADISLYSNTLHKIKNQWNTGWKSLASAISTRPEIIQAMDQALSSRNMEWDGEVPSDEELENLFPGRKR